MLRTVVGMTLAAVLLTAGCAEFQELSIAQRNRKAASGAWKAARWEYWQQGVPHKLREHVGRGFEQGYYDVASGSSGEIPLFPPSVYWGTRYQNPEGTAYIGAWFRGYQDGAMAAERDGLSQYNQIPTSWAPAMGNQMSSSGVPGLPPGATPYTGEVVPSIPAADSPVPMVPVVPVHPSTELPVLPEAGAQPLVVPTPSATIVEPVVPAQPAPGAAAPKLPIQPEAKPVVPAVPTPRDPIGGKQTEYVPEAEADLRVVEPATAQESLFGETVEIEL